jgi:hypothetical protein
MPAEAKIRRDSCHIASIVRRYNNTMQTTLQHVCKLPPLGL